MAEVFGIISGAVGVLDVSTRGVQRLNRICSRWSNCPEDLLALRNEIEDLRVILDQIKNAETAIAAASQQDATLSGALSEHLRRANEHVTLLNDTLERLSSFKKLKQKFEWVRKEGGIESLKRRIRGVREDINSLLVTHDVIRSARVELDILSAAAVGAERHNHVTNRLDALGSNLTETRNELTVFRNDVQRFTDSGEEFADLFQQFMSRVDVKLDSFMANTQGTTDSYPTSGQSTPLPPPRCVSKTYNTIQFTTARHMACSEECKCPCHSSDSSSSRWSSRSYILGSLFLRYTGWPRSDTQCDPDCKTKHQARAHFTYIFPIWFLQYSIHCYFRRVLGRNPEMLLVLKNRVQWTDNPLFSACSDGDLRLVQLLYREAPWRVRDVRDTDGTNPLFWAVRWGHIDVVKFLVSVGGGIDEENDDGETATHYLSRLSIAKLDRSQDLDTEMYQLLKVREYIEEVQLPEITRSILRFPGARDLEDLVRQFPHKSALEAKAKDEFGRTALHWACGRGDWDAVRVLLDLGADANALGSDARTPLHGAVTHPDGYLGVKILFKAGAKVSRDMYSYSPLHLASQESTAETVEALRDHGVSLDETTGNGQSPLLIAANVDNLSTLECLLDNGANAEANEDNGCTALLASIWSNAHKCIESLLKHKVCHTALDNDDSNALHYAAWRGDVRTFQILAQHRLPGLDIDAKDSDGMIASALFQNRPSKTNELEEAFNALLDAVLAASTELEESGGIEEDSEDTNSKDDEYFDAQETF